MAVVRFGSLGDMAACLAHVRFTPNSGHQAVGCDVRFVPKDDIDLPYSITFSARRVGGMSMLIALPIDVQTRR